MGATGGSFEIFQNGHIFLKFCFFLNIKKKKAPYDWATNCVGHGPWQRELLGQIRPVSVEVL